VGIRQTLSIAGRARPKPREEIGRRGEDDRLSVLRVRAARLRKIGIRLTGEQRAQRLVARLDDLASRSEAFAKSDLPRLWHEIETGDSMLGLCPIGEPAGGRIMLVQIASTEPGRRFSAAEVQGLATLLPTLVRRTVLALGDERAEETRWLTVREQIVLDHLILGKSVRQIADELERSPHTVHDHVKSLHRKLNASSRGELIARALGHASAEPAAAIEPKPMPKQAAAAIEPKPASERSAQPSED
jgi:DNA-binding CsgD family transcriptional regulator